MYLKSLEIIGFKSFANKTRLDFEPGITTIVGPNGCGKSNVSDAVRWVLGEQRARALRGTKMEDVIFAGTDSKKPLGMAEVSLTLADCTDALGIEYDEVCVTRRVFRSGESGYFLNRKACRLKEIQRLFMDTGIGTDAYSILEQGQIDRILSSRPEDRRAVFEEAGGITKYKADRKEALRKLERVEANLLRLDDVVREVRRQILSLQRQAGKARRYKALAEELQTLDVFVTRRKLEALAERIDELNGELNVSEGKASALREQAQAAEAKSAEARERLATLEERIARTMEQASQAHGELERTKNLVGMNVERIGELESLVRRGERETEEAQARLAELRKEAQKTAEELLGAEGDRSEAEKRLETALREQREAEARLGEAREEASKLREEATATENQTARLRSDLADREAKERGAVLERERLRAERDELERAVAAFRERNDDANERTRRLASDVERERTKTLDIERQRDDLRQRLERGERALNETRKTLAAKQARAEMLSGIETRKAGFPPGAQRLIDPPEKLPAKIADGLIGPLAERLRVAPEYQTALEAVLRPVADALIVKHADVARATLDHLRAIEAGSVRLLCADTGAEAPETPNDLGERLVDLVECDADVAPLFRRLFRNVRVLSAGAEPPSDLPAGSVVVSRDGIVLCADGTAELWMPDAPDATPLARHRLRESLQAEIAELEATGAAEEKKLSTLRDEAKAANETLLETRKTLEELRRELALREGERRAVEHEIERTEARRAAAERQLESLDERLEQGDGRRDRLAAELREANDRLAALRERIERHAERLATLDERRTAALETAAEGRIAHARRAQAVERLHGRKSPQEARIRELETLVAERTAGIEGYRRRIVELQESIETDRKKVPDLERRREEANERLDLERRSREENVAALADAERRRRERQVLLDAESAEKSKLELALAECRMRRENALERLLSAYRLDPEELDSIEPPSQEDGEPADETLDARIAELRAKLESMGPVNLVAIEEHAELEERYAFLDKQQKDLLDAKKQLLDLIREINATTTELFRKTFDRVDASFRELFKKLFGGGEARLELLDAENVLESGIEIVARPPGKRLQNISLLSGGERTMTAVALLFALFKVKPGPFCVMDELDAALDDANIGRFVDTLREFLTHSQFILITHSRQTIAAADVIYGVTMETRGISKVVSMKFSDYREE